MDQDQQPRPLVQRLAGTFARSAGYGALVTPIGLVTLPAALAGYGDAVQLWRSRLAGWVLRDGTAAAERRAGRLAVSAHAVLSILTGLVCWFLISMWLLVFARGPLYPLVDHGPYDNSWGGPTLAGAWAAHLAVSLPFLLVTPVLLGGLVGTHARSVRLLDGQRAGRWVVPVLLVAALLGTLFFVAWLNQL